TARGLAALGVGRGAAIGILAANHPAFLVLLYACARLGAVLVPVNWRLAVPEQLYILRDAAVDALVLAQSEAAIVAPLAELSPATRVIGLDFLPAAGTTFAALQQDGGAPHRGHGDLSLPLLTVYTSGTTGRPKGAVLRQEALVWNGLMSQHMHDMT